MSSRHTQIIGISETTQPAFEAAMVDAIVTRGGELLGNIYINDAFNLFKCLVAIPKGRVRPRIAELHFEVDDPPSIGMALTAMLASRPGVLIGVGHSATSDLGVLGYLK